MPHSKTEANSLHIEGRRLLRLIDTRRFPHLSCSAIGTEAGGRPFFTDHHADFNISHSMNMVAVGYAPSGLVTRIGCDIQFMDERKNIEGLAKRAFSSAEREFLASAADSAERLTRFYQIWTFKESYIKLYGLSIFDSLKVNAPDFTSDTLRSAFLQENNAFRQYRLEKGAAERYILCCIWKTRGFLEYGGEETSPEIRWFSKSLPLTSISPAAC